MCNKHYKDSRTITTWKVLAEVDDLMQNIVTWKKVNWESEETRRNFIDKHFIAHKRYRQPKGNNRYRNGKILC